MRTAILISGQARCIKDNFENFKSNVLDRFWRHDIFISTWVNDGIAMKSSGNIVYEDEPINEIIKLYNPRTIEVQKYDLDMIDFIIRSTVKFGDPIEVHEDTMFHNMMMMFYKWSRVKDMFHPLDYNFAIKYRFEINIKKGDIIPGHHLYIPMGGNFRGGIGDVMCYGNPQLVHEYLSIWDYLTECYNGVGYMHPESLLRYYLNDMRKIYPSRTPIEFTVRGREYNKIADDAKEYIDNKLIRSQVV